jgi:ankyrin repeat protein
MKHLLLTTIAAVLLVGCGPPKPPDTSIHDAAEEGNIEAVKQHIAAGTDVNAKYADGELTPLLIAAGEGQKEIAELLIAKGADVNAKSWSGATPLLIAAIDGHKEIAELLIARGADVNAKEDDGWTPLHYAISEGHKETVELLIANGADVNAKKANGETPLDLAWRDDRTSALLLKHGGKTGAELSIHKAASEGNIEAVKQHLAAGADVNAKTMHGDTPLDRAIRNPFKDKNKAEIADLLRKHGGKTGEELKAEGK